MKVPFDPIASKMAEKMKITVIIARGTNLKNLENILLDKKFKGTIIANIIAKNQNMIYINN